MACSSQIVDKFTRVCQFLFFCFPKCQIDRSPVWSGSFNLQSFSKVA